MLSCRMSTALFFMIPLFFIRICWWEVTMTVVIQIFCCRSFLPDEEFWSLYLRNHRGIMNSMIRSGYYVVCTQKSCNVWFVTEKRTASLILSAGIDTGTLHRTHGFDRIPDDRNTSACSHLYTETSFWICHHRAAGKDRSYEQQLLYELFQTEFRSRSHWISESGTYPISMRPSAQYGSQYLRHCFRYRIS